MRRCNFAEAPKAGSRAKSARAMVLKGFYRDHIGSLLKGYRAIPKIVEVWIKWPSIGPTLSVASRP